MTHGFIAFAIPSSCNNYKSKIVIAFKSWKRVKNLLYNY